MFVDFSKVKSEGPQGPMGPQGPQGEPGPQGPQGPQGEKVKLQKKDYSITENGTTAIAPDPEFDGIFTGDINVDVQPALQEKTVEIKANAAYVYTPDEGFYGISKLKVNAQIEATGSALNVAGTGWETEPFFPVDLSRAATLEDDLNYTRQKFAEWDPSGWSLYEKYKDDRNLVYAPKIDTSNVTNMCGAFRGCSNLVEIPLLDTHKVKDMGQSGQYNEGCFKFCTNLKSIPSIDTGNVGNMNNCFLNCYSLKSIGQLNCSNVKSMSYCFQGCTNLTDLGGFIGLKVSTNLSISTKLTKQSLLNVIAGLGQADPSFEANPELKLGSTNLAKLTEEEIAVATSKGWTVA